ncbi:MAG: T9SS type A sorting domain-containing protein [Flavobacteriales bacterium]|nr:T9SS type A sorting domain-containing protein [Flavobacteriales bacterium]
MKQTNKVIRLKSIVLSVLLSFMFTYCTAKTIESERNGNWNNPSTWDCNCVPKHSDNVIIKSGDIVLVNKKVITIKNLTIETQSTLSVSISKSTINITGDWINNGTFNSNNGKVVMKGNSNQVIGGSSNTSFYELDIKQKSGGNSAKKVSLNKSINVYKSLNLKKGVLQSDVYHLPTLKSSADIPLGSDDSYINGPIRIETDDIKEIVIGTGKNGKHKKTALNITSGDPSVFMVEYFDQPHVYAYAGGTNIDHVCTSEFWNINRISGNASASVSLHWDGNSCGSVNNMPALKVARFDGSQWVNEGGDVLTGNTSGGSITSQDLDDFGSFTFGCEHSGSRMANGHQSQDNFETPDESFAPLDEDYQELDNDYQDMTDEPIRTQTTPNPTTKDKLCINVYGETGQEVLIVVMDLLGNEHYSKVCLMENGKQTVGHDYNGKLSAGVYLIIASSKNKYYKEKIIIR